MVLIGEDTSKRSVYLKKAAEQLGVSFQEISWSMMNREFDFGQLQGKGIKIDPPSYEAVHLCHMEELLRNYRHQLAVLSSVQGSFLNHPQAIAGLLDKKQSKLYLQSKGLPVTKMFSETIESKEQLLWLMKEERCYSVFVKPRYFSGAAGVAADRKSVV